MAGTITLRPSGAPIWVYCPGAPALWASIPPDETDVAREGRAAHWLAEMILTGQYTGEELIDRQSPEGVFISETMLDHVAGYVEFVRRKLPDARIEEPVTIFDISPGMTGTPDAHGIRETCVTIIDFKYGWRIVEPFENWQLMTYAAGLSIPQGVTLVELVIYQPRASHPDGTVRRWITSVADLQSIYWPRLQASARGGDCKTGPHCRDCPASTGCKAARESGYHSAQFVCSPIIETYDGAQLATELYMLEAAEQSLTARIEAIRPMATARAIAKPGAIPGWELDRSNGSERWLPDTDLPTLAALSGVPLTKPKNLTPNQARDAGLSPAMVAQYSERSMGKPKLVPHDPNKLLNRMNRS